MAGAAQCGKDNEDIADLTSPVTKVHKKKRKKKTRIERGDGGSETEECKVTLSDAEEELKQMKLSDGSTLKSVSKRKKKKEKERRDVEGGESLPLKDLQCSASMADDRQTGSAETKAETETNKKKKKKNKKHLDDDHGATAMAEPECDNCLDVDTLDQNNKEGLDNAKMSDSQSQQSREEEEEEEEREEEESCLQEDAEETVANGDDKTDVEPLLMPLVHEGKSVAVTKEKKQIVKRQLPQWIVEADIIPDDIIEQSR